MNENTFLDKLDKVAIGGHDQDVGIKRFSLVAIKLLHFIKSDIYWQKNHTVKDKFCPSLIASEIRFTLWQF